MKWKNGSHEWEAGWEEPLVVERRGVEGKCGYVWAVPTQEGFALQMNALVSTLTLALILQRKAIVMPFIGNGPHYRKDVALGKMKAWFPMSEIIDIGETLKATKGYESVSFIEFHTVEMPNAAKCISCAGKPPQHIHCPRGWLYEWCRPELVRRTQKPKCAMRFTRDECAACIFSVGFGAGIQRTEPRWYALKQNLVIKKPKSKRLKLNQSYCALQMRRGDKTTYYEKAGLSVDKVLAVATKKCQGLPLKYIATDDRSESTRLKALKAGFLMLNTTYETALEAYLADLLLCVHADIYVGTASKRMTSKQAALVQALRAGKRRREAHLTTTPDDDSASSSSKYSRRKRDFFLITA